MDLESPLRTIASPVEAETLRVLAGADAEFSASEVHRLIESASPYGVRKALARLADAGLVLSTVHGNVTFWRGNRQHVLWPAIESAVDARRVLLDRLRDELAKRNGLAAYLYGSFARRSAGPDSDIDILVVYPDDTSHDTIVDFAFDLSEQIRAWTGNEGHLYNATRTWLQESIEGADPVVMSIRQDAVTLMGPEFEQLLREIRSEKLAHA
ncbi:nucleotidyltransferase domain-containing protein [Herbiconiux sp. CPCC 205763]|uniref:Nucleotidyltransferase domain-containing protein n=1 Tax=Herbiconiux aconitum TaxID=2970913 RepID=A0ABT2GQM6_9MICO|nr:nucleotidyltransferase domain-containing protein [Herbiconiux aconitum]MCS5718473.1 nucleotidyltransferase domain-containing protein [Herbiconiux aconitum]